MSVLHQAKDSSGIELRFQSGPYASAFQAGLLMGFVPLYGWLAAAVLLLRHHRRLSDT